MIMRNGIQLSGWMVQDFRKDRYMSICIAEWSGINRITGE